MFRTIACRSDRRPAAGDSQGLLVPDESGPTNSSCMDKRCRLEARSDGMQTLNVTEQAATVQAAVKSAASKLERMLDDAFQRLADLGVSGHR